MISRKAKRWGSRDASRCDLDVRELLPVVNVAVRLLVWAVPVLACFLFIDHENIAVAACPPDGSVVTHRKHIIYTISYNYLL
jgi:hypothetical protein